MQFEKSMEAFEVTGVVILAAGSILALVQSAAALRTGGGRAAYIRARRGVGPGHSARTEVLIIADI